MKSHMPSVEASTIFESELGIALKLNDRACRFSGKR
jgi:hypothetical protein